MDDAIAEELRTKLAVPLWPVAGQALDLGREATFSAARRGTFPGAFRIGKEWRVATRPLRQILKIENPDPAEPAEAA